MSARPTFDPDRKFVVEKAFRYNGVDHGVGVPFDPDAVDCTPEKLKRLYDGRFVSNASHPIRSKQPVEVEEVKADDDGFLD